MGNTLTLEQKADLALKEAQEAVDYMEIQNLVSAHLYCYRAQKQFYEIEHFWARERDDIAYANVEGREAVVNFYCVGNEKMRAEKLRLVHTHFPEVAIAPENDGAGDMVSKLSTNPYVEIAADGASARGVWFSPGICSEIGPDGGIKATYFQEKIGLDFIRESDGCWKILRLNLFPEIIRPIPRSAFPEEAYVCTYDQLGDGKAETAAWGSPAYSLTTVADFYPPLPKPYDTWEDVQSFTAE